MNTNKWKINVLPSDIRERIDRAVERAIREVYGAGPDVPTVAEVELARIREALETWRDEWKKANDPDVYWDAYDTIARIDAILAPEETTK